MNLHGVDSCCKDCRERAIGCHGACERYREYKARLEAEKAARRKIKDTDSYEAHRAARFMEMKRRGGGGNG